MKEKIKNEIIDSYGQPDQLIQLMVKNKGINLIVYRPIEDENDEFMVITAGLFAEGNARKEELIWIFRSDPERQESILVFIQSAIREILENNIELEPGKTIEINSSINGKTYVIFYQDSSVYETVQLDKVKSIPFLIALPIYKEEAKYFESLSLSIKMTLLDQIWQLYLTKDVREVYNSYEIGVNSIWNQVLNWHKENDTILYKEVTNQTHNEENNDSISEIDTYLERVKDLQYFLTVYSKPLSISDYVLLTKSEVTKNWEMMNNLLRNKSIKNWDMNWIPFAEDGGGNLMIIDTSDPKQMIYFLEADVLLTTKIKGFTDWLRRYRNDLYANKFEVDEEGFLYKY